MRVCPISSPAMAVGMTDPQEDWPLVVLAAAEGICDLSEALRRAVASWWPSYQRGMSTPTQGYYNQLPTNYKITRTIYPNFNQL